MKIILVLNLLILGSAMGYKLGNISISDFEFRRYVRPQLKSITNEFQTLFFALNPELKDYKSAYGHFKKIGTINQQIRRDCALTTGNCSADIALVESTLQSAMEALDQDGSVDSNSNSALKDAQTRLTYQHSRELLRQRTFQMLLKTQNMLFQKSLTGKFALDLMNYTDELNYLYDQFHTFLFKSSDPRFKNEVSSFWVNFIRPVETFALHQNNREFFVTRLTDLNMRWHMLNVRLTKRSFSPTKQVSTLLNIMHRRWNNVLKVSLDPNG